MPNVRVIDWVRIEGCEISDLKQEYGTLKNIPNNQQHVYFGHPEVQLNNPYSSTHSCIYTLRSIKDFFGYKEIHDIDDNWNRLINNIGTYMQNELIDIDDQDTAYYYVNQPFNVSESSVLFYEDSRASSTTGSKYTRYCIILVDEFAQPNVVNITAKYNGDAVPVGEQFDETLLEVTAIYDDGNEMKIKSGYTYDPPNGIVNQLGANVFTCFYTDPEGDINTCPFIIEGCRNLQSISGYWDGGMVAYGKEAEKKYFVIIAHFSDNTESTVTDFSFPNNNIVTKTNKGLIDVFYQGHSCQVQVPPFEVKQSRLIAYYNGPMVEVGHHYQTSYLTVRIFYSSGTEINNSYYEDIDVENCTISSTYVEDEGVNTYTVSYDGKVGTITTSFTVTGFVPDLKPTAIEATYNGPGVYQGKTFDLERVLCNIFYNNGTIKTVKNFVTSTNIVKEVGINEITVTYIEEDVTLTDVIYVNGLENDATTQNNIFRTQLVNNYPKATFLNNRYRGPAEGVKTNNYSIMITNNIKELYKLFVTLETQYNKIIEEVSGDNSTKILTFNNVSYMDHQILNILNDDHYTTGKYKTEDVTE